jgi:cysteine-S-conjugate beta-lyase
MTRDAVSTSGTPITSPGRHKHDAACGADGGRPAIPAPQEDVRIAGGHQGRLSGGDAPVQDGGVPGNLRQAIDTTTAATLRARGSFKWTAPGPGGFGAAVAEMDFGAAPAILDALARLSADANFGYLPPYLAEELAAACADFMLRRFGWGPDPALIHPVPDVIKALEIAITHFSRPGSPIILPTPAYMPFLIVPGFLGREIIQVRMHDEAGFFTFDLDAIAAAFRAGGHLLIFCNPCNPLGRVFTHNEMTQLTDMVDRHGGRVFADEVHAPLVYPGSRHIPYASTSGTAAAHTLTATSASKAWNLPGLKCAEVILTNQPDRQRWEDMGLFASHGASNPGVVANIAAFRHGEAWLDEVLAYLDDSRRLLADLLTRHLPQVRYRPPDGTYLAWLDCAAMELPQSPGALITDLAQITVVDGPAFGDGGDGAFRFNFATPQPILTQMVERIAAALAAR